ncbi:unnamed protein product [Camellia sinensis]
MIAASSACVLPAHRSLAIGLFLRRNFKRSRGDYGVLCFLHHEDFEFWCVCVHLHEFGIFFFF